MNTAKAGQFIAKHKVIIIVAIIIIIVAVIFYRKGKKNTTLSDLPNDNPTVNNGNGGVNMNGNQISANEVVLLADQVHADIHCIFCTRNYALYERLGVLSDTDLVRVYNAYNSKYQAEDGETMLQALDNEFANFDTLKNRLRKYNAK
jgi:hypothetical protein